MRGVGKQITLGVGWPIAAEEGGLVVVESLLPGPQLQWLKGKVWCWCGREGLAIEEIALHDYPRRGGNDGLGRRALKQTLPIRASMASAGRAKRS